MDQAKEVIQGLINDAENEVNQWKDARNSLPYPEFSEDTRKDEVWASGLAEGKAIGRLIALKDVLSKIK